ncbi:MAG: hypothetical protein ACRD8A_08835 [Candidatus Acidiferrales bacterium]
MADSFCLPCQSRGFKTAAHRVVRDDESGKVTPKCDLCWRQNRHVVAQQKGPTLAQLAEKALCVRIGSAGPPFSKKQLQELTEIVTGEPPARKEERVERVSAVDWAAVDRDDAAGMATKDIAKKYAVSPQQVYKRRYNRAKACAQPKAKTAAAKTAIAKAGAKSAVEDAIDQLRTKVTELDTKKAQFERIIVSLRELEGLS